MNTNTLIYDCGIHKNHFLAPLIAILPFFVTIGFDTMWLLQDKIPVMIQSTQPNQWTKQQLQQNSTNRHVSCDAVLHEHLLHRISPAMTAFTLIIFNLHGNGSELYGRVVHSTDDNTSNSNQDDSHCDSTNGPQVAASSSEGGDDDDEDDPFNRKLHNNGCGGDKSPSGQNDNEEEDNHDNENGFNGETVDVLESNNPDDFLNVTFDDDMDIVLNEIVEVGVVGEEDEEDMVRLWEE